MNHEAFETLAAVHLLDALDGEDRAMFESHLAEGCAQCEAALREFQETFARLAERGPRAIPPADVKRALLERLAATAPSRAAARQRSRWLAWAAGTAAAVVVASAATAAFVAGHYEAQLGQMARETSALRERLEQHEQALRAELAVYRTVVDLLRDPSTRVVALRGVSPRPEAVGRVLWNDAGGGHVLVSNLPPPPAGKTYELWTISGGTPRPAGTFATDASGTASRPIPPVPERKPVDVFAITVEPEGGVPAPTGPIILASK